MPCLTGGSEDEYRAFLQELKKATTFDYFDVGTGKHYNYFRDYDPAIGRYIESDPIGLWGGWNTFAYVRNNSLVYLDRLGLAPNSACVAACTVGGAATGGALGTLIGGVGGATGGAIGGTAVAPGPGTVVGGVVGAQAGAASLGPMGTLLGGSIGLALGQAICPDQEKEKCKKECVAAHERDMEECNVVSVFWGPKAFIKCRNRAGEDLGKCMRRCDGKE